MIFAAIIINLFYRLLIKTLLGLLLGPYLAHCIFRASAQRVGLVGAVVILPPHGFMFGLNVRLSGWHKRVGAHASNDDKRSTQSLIKSAICYPTHGAFHVSREYDSRTLVERCDFSNVLWLINAAIKNYDRT